MNNSIPQHMYATLVRHQFYTKIDWEMCEWADEQSLEREFRAVIGVLIDSDACELPAQAKSELEESIIRDVQVFGVAKMAEYSATLSPRTTFFCSAIDWVTTPLRSCLDRHNRAKDLARLKAR